MIRFAIAILPLALLLLAQAFPAQAQSSAAGSALYAQQCAACHNANPRNDPQRANGGVRLGANNAQNILDAINFKVPAMSYLAGVLSLPRDADDIAAWLATVFSPAPAAGVLRMPSPMVFADRKVGTQSSPRTVSITNTGTAAVTVASITSSHPAEFALVSQTCTSAPVPAGGSCQLSLAFTPGATGLRSATITVGSNGSGSPQSFAVSGTGVVDDTPNPLDATLPVIEYFHAAFGHYFVTANADEITKLDNGTFVGWARTGRSFKAWIAASAGRAPVCRFFTVAFPPKSSHFYTSNAAECADVKTNPDWTFEAEVFHVLLPAADGSCAAGTEPVYRVYNNGLGGAPNHRYVTELELRADMLARGYIAEGAGIGVGLCVPQ
jgi:cytochrome c553